MALEFNNDNFENEQTYFVDVILPLPLGALYTYRVPREFVSKVDIGLRTVVQFGKKRILTAIIAKVHHTPPIKYEAKYLLDLLDDSPTVNQIQMKLFEWMSGYYMCTFGEVLNAAMPSGLKLSSESKIQLNPNYSGNYEFTETEKIILEALEAKNLGYSEVIELTNKKAIHPIIKSLLAKDAVLIYEELKEKYTPKVISKIRLNDSLVEDKVKLQSLFGTLEKKDKQVALLMRYIQLIGGKIVSEKNRQGVSKANLLNADVSASALSTLIKNEVFVSFNQVISRFEEYENELIEDASLSQDQALAKNEILDHFKEKDTVLLHGITGSGKTEVYIELIKNALLGGSQVLFLLPEIALTTQIVSRMRKYFGDKMGIYHSKFSDNERVEVWRGVSSGKISFIIGVRSSVFLPFDNLGLVIVDEEHESSYKQYDPAPRYHARDTAIMLANFHQAKIVLGSATPSVESYFRAKSGKYGLVNLSKRYGDALLPEIMLVNTLHEKKYKRMKNDFSAIVLDELKLCLDNNHQAIIFQNRRGYAPYVNCEDCAYIPKCISCSVSLTYHMHTGDLICHYCGFKEKVPKKCEACGSTKIKAVGFGTEKLEEDVKLFLPEARVQRMDLDTTRNKNAYQNIIHDFEVGKTNVLVGTQMVTKGLDFDKVTLVIIFDADRMIHFPDFRSTERAFQTLAQVSGRAGRRRDAGKVYIQTNSPNHSLFHLISNHDYTQFYLNEITEREKFHYPPFFRLIKISCKDPEKHIALELATLLALRLKEMLGDKRVLGPEAPLIDKIRNYYYKDILIKLENGKVNLAKVKKFIKEEAFTIKSSSPKFTHTFIVFDVDPA